ncbi:MAG: vWA domain-containing protein [Pyrinomonadaceae bacterium]
MNNTFFIVDALNICKEASRRPRLATLLSLLVELKKQGHDFLCVFDESAYREFRDQGGEGLSLYNSLVHDYTNHFSQIRGKADEKIVAIANKDDSAIISNDSFREYRQRYPWLRDRDRLVKVSVVRKMIFSERIGIEASEYETDAEAWDELKLLLDSKGQPKKPIAPSKRNATTSSEPKPTSTRSRRTPKTSVPRPKPPSARARNSSFEKFPSIRSAKRVTPIAEIDEEEQKPKERTRKKMPTRGDEIVDQLLSRGFITPDIAQILKRATDEQVTVVQSTKNEMVAVVLVIDRSGSMSTWHDAVIEGQKILIQGLLGASSFYDIRFAQILFNDRVEYFQEFCEFRDRKNSRKTSPDVKFLDHQTYVPGGLTALYDAILKGVCSLTPLIYAANEQGLALETRVCILTDGIDEGALGPGTGSKIPPPDLARAVNYMLGENLINEIILAGIGNYDFKQVGNSVGIQNVMSIPTDTNNLEETKRQIRRTFNLWSKTGKTQ